MVLPYMCRVTIAGPEADDGGVSTLIDAVADAVKNGWDAPLVYDDESDDEMGDEESSGGEVLDHRILGYPGGAIVLVVLDCDDFMQASVVIAALARHLTSWSPALLEYAPSGLEISPLDKPYDEDNWLPPIADEESDPRPRWPLSALLDENVKELAGQYLLAAAIRAIWHPTERAHRDPTDDIVAGSVEYPWGTVLSRALGILLIRAARFESQRGSQAKLIVHGSGDLALANDLLQRARQTGDEDDDGDDFDEEELTDDAMRGHVLVEDFMEAHDLQWNRVADDERSEEPEARSNRQLRILLWAGLRAAATLCVPLASLSGPWQVLDQLGDDEVVSLYAEQEEEDNETAAKDDDADVYSASAAHVLVWLAIRHPDLLESRAAGTLIADTADDVTAFHQVFNATMVMAGYESLKTALAQQRIPARLRPGIDTYAAALSETERDDPDEDADAYNDMHLALEAVLAGGPGMAKRIRFLLTVLGAAVRTADSGSRSTDGTPASTPRSITYYLLIEPSMHSATVLHRDNDDAAIRAAMLGLAAQVSPLAAAGLIAELPGLTGDDPRLEPAALTRATTWVQEAVQVAQQHGYPVDAIDNGTGQAADAQEVINAISVHGCLPPEWPVHRVVPAAAYAAAAILHASETVGRAGEVFTEN
ncbi:hypothetical protein [Paractinoplanes lichenicola]|uniref:Uncharacterized protein n=1 Tax=Paractinoplanes lichenicola TaxID=2802976 RepID=A0ABS1W4B9_9ACTN|nr:hypothetical protein [Actinoplanes lichenicola]MBL7261585.1 hypothetical protein [Actinoplanes lichenicola]